MTNGGISKRIVNFAKQLVGWMPGGLAVVDIVASMIFAAMTGAGAATTAAVGGMMIPHMEEEGYDPGFASAIQAMGGVFGPIIPPSTLMVLYAVASGESVGGMFLGGILPGLYLGLVLIIVVVMLCKKKGYGGGAKFDGKAFVKATVDAFWALLAPIIILGGIYSGWFTPTEAAVISVVYSYIVGRFVYKELDAKAAYKALRDTVIVNGATTFMVGLSSAFAAYLSLTGIPRTLAAAMLGITDNKILLFVLINLFLLIVGCLVDNIPATIILAPILLPVVTALGMSPVTFGIMLTMNLAIGFCTPPYGIDLFVASAISGVSIGKMMKYMIWFLFALLVVLMLVTYWPAFTLFAFA